NNFTTGETNNVILADLTEANFNNCIIYGNDNQEVLIDKMEDNAVVFNFKFTNSLIRFDNRNNNTEANYNFNDTNHYEGNIFNLNPDFKDPSKNQLNIGYDSPAINKGLALFASQVPNDILNVDRMASPDLGAYQHVMFAE